MGLFSFNLLDESWIPCLDNIGKSKTFGLRDLLVNAHEVRSLDHQSPLTEAALLRLLLASVHRIVWGPRSLKEWAELYRSGQLSEQRVAAYLDKWWHRFDLFSEEAPFYQTAGLAVLDNAGNPAPAPISSIMLERASGNNKTIFDHSTDETPLFLSPAESALALVTAQMYGLGGLNRKTTNHFGYQQSFFHGVMVNGIFVAMQGSNLFETLMLNLLIYQENEPIPSKKTD